METKNQATNNSAICRLLSDLFVFFVVCSRNYLSPGLWHIGGTLAGTSFCECIERNRSENSQVASWWHIEQATNNSKSRQQTIQSEKSENSDRQQTLQFICCLIFLPNFRLSIYLFSLFSRFLFICCQEVCDIAGLPRHAKASHICPCPDLPVACLSSFWLAFDGCQEDCLDKILN